MFRLTLNPDTESNTHVFDKDVIVLGYSETDDIDLPLSDLNLEKNHIRILAVADGYLIENTAQDPFATVNDLPFGKKRLRSNDRIHLGKITLLFEEGVQVLPNLPKNIEKRVDALPIGQTTELIQKKSKVFAASLILLCVLSFFSVIKGGVDFLESVKEHEEHIAIQVVADTAMALMYTKIHETGPDRQIFSDPHFMEKGLVAVLGKAESFAMQVDAQGRFKDIPYILRIYTSPDLRQFLVMAQPTPSLLNWLKPKGSVVVDSSLMDLRKVENIKELNRLLVYINSPEEGKLYADLVVEFLKKEPQVSLLELGKKFPNRGYSPPQELKVVKPGAENYIYNAPRYYSFTAPVVSEAVDLLEGIPNRKAVTKLKSTLDNLSIFPDIVYYTTQGSTYARHLKNALKVWSDRDDFVATLFLTDDAEFLSHTLVLDETPVDFFEPTFAEDEVALETNLSPFEDEIVEEIDLQDPLYVKMRRIASAREELLSPIGEEIIALIEAENKSPTLNFFSAMKTLLNRYREVSCEYQQVAINEVIQLYQEVSFMPFFKFFSFAKKAEIDNYILENQRVQRKLDRDVLTVEEFQELVDEIQEATTGLELQKKLSEVVSLLTLHTVPNIEELMVYQKTVRIEVTEKLRELILSGSVEASEVEAIRKLAWIIEVDGSFRLQ